MLVVTTMHLSEKHQEQFHHQFPQHELQVYPSIDEARHSLPQAEILLTYGEDLTVDLLEEMKQLQWIHVISAGIDRLPFNELEQRGILVTNARGIHAIPMAEYTIWAILTLARQGKKLFTQQEECLWDRSTRMTEVAEQTLGILGTGAIGQEIARKAKALDLRVIGYNRSGEHPEHFDVIVTGADLNQLFQEADYIVSVLPRTADTDGLVDQRRLHLMKRDASFINIGRGNVVDEEALIEVLRNQRIKGAVLDVFQTEPLPVEHPFWSLENCIVTPHLSGRFPKYMERAMNIFYHNLHVWEDRTGELKNKVDLTRRY